MMEDMNDIELILWIEKRFGITKTVGENPSSDRVESVENELVGLLSKYRQELRITSPLPKIRIWITNDKLNFTFFDRKSGNRIYLGDWLQNKGASYDS